MMNKKIHLILGNKSEGDKAVTNTYLDTIIEAFKESDYLLVKENNSKIDKNDVLLFDECKVAFPYCLKKYKNITVWIQGVVPEEALLKGYSHLRFTVNSIIERFVLKHASLILFCSDAMKDHYEKKYNLTFKNYVIMPCYNETSINEQSFSKEKYSKNNFVYVGSLSEWQCFDKTLEIYKKIERESNVDSKLFIYTNEQEKAKRLVHLKGIKNFYISYVKPELLGEALKDMKYGFVIREDNIVNNVATPTKISNYIAHGIIPIYSESLISFNDFNIQNKGFAVVCNPGDMKIENILNSMRSIYDVDEMKTWCSNVFDTYYNQNKYINLIKDRIRRMK